jgi:WD40 repeat protein
VFSPDGQRVVTASRDKTARVWNAATGQVIAKLEGHSGPVLSAVFSPDRN